MGAAPLYQVSYAAQPAASEYELKAVYLYNFLQFVTWPETDDPVLKDGVKVIGVVGESPFGRALDELQSNVRNERMSPVRVVFYGPYREGLNLSRCHLLFVTGSEKRHFSKIVSSLKGTSVLTVADTESFLSSGGMVALVNSQGKIRWMINRPPAERAGLRFRAQMLSIALRVLE